jgi:hypothetical protein
MRFPLIIFVLHGAAFMVMIWYIIFKTHDVVYIINRIPEQTPVIITKEVFKDSEILDKLNELIANSIREDLIIIDDETGLFVYDKRKDSMTALDRDKFKEIFVK